MSPSRQSGATLIVSLVLLLVVTITGATALRITSLQETTTAGQRHKTLSLMAAEAGASATWAAFNVSNKQNWWVGLPRNGSNAALPIGDNNTAWTMDYVNTPSESGGTVFVLGVARNGANGQVLARSKIKLELGQPANGGLPGVLNGGMFANNDIDVKVSLAVTGNGLANNLAKGNITVSGGAVTSNSGYTPWEPAFTDPALYTADYFKADLDKTPSSGCRNSAGQSVTLPSTGGNLNGAVYYCASAVLGSSSTNRTFSNGTIVTKGDLTTYANLYNMKLIAGNTLKYYKGALGSSTQSSSIVSVNAFSQESSSNVTLFGALWSGNSAVFKGGLSATGCLFVANTLTLEKASTFVQDSANCGAQLGTPGSPTIVTWREVTD